MKLLYSSGFLFIICFFSCSSPTDNNTDQRGNHPEINHIQSLVTIANCSGPNGNYTTTVHSTNNGYTYFMQEYDYNGGNFGAVLSDPETGFQYSLKGETGEPVSSITREIIRGHEFHKISLMPETYFSEITFTENRKFDDLPCKLYSGIDPSGNQASIFFTNEDNLLKAFEFKNPTDTAEKIWVVNRTWQDSPFGKMVKTVDVIQGTKDTFYFDFQTIEINENSFIKKLSVTEGRLLNAVHQFNTAFREGNLNMLDSMVTDNYVHTNGNSPVITKEDWFNYLKKRKATLDSGELVIKDYKMNQTKIEMHGNTAILTARVSVSSENKGKVANNAYRVTNIWVNQNDLWKRAGFHDGKIE